MYNAGISAADGRVNTSSASYSSGYNAGHSVTKIAETSGNDWWSFSFTASQSMTKGLVLLIVARDTTGIDLNSVTCNTGSLSLMSSYDGQDYNKSGVYIRVRYYIWTGNGQPTISVKGGAMQVDYGVIIKLG